LDADEKPVYPGFNDAHAHFHGYATTLQNVDLSHTRSWEEVLEKTWKFAQSNPQGWLVGRGWDQNEWAAPLFPDKELLDSLFPNRPVLLRRIDGHAAVANRLALDIAEIHEGQEVPGGLVQHYQGKLSGLLLDNAVNIVSQHIPPVDSARLATLLRAAQDSCFAYGLTSLSDCGLSVAQIHSLHNLQKSGQLTLRINAMIQDRDSDVAHFLKTGPVYTDYLRVASVK